jgi:8-oxo-dGTP diphosphatase
MEESMQKIRTLDANKIDETVYPIRFVGCVVLSKDNKIVLQQRGENWKNHPGFLSEFGGHIEPGEKPMEALVLELNEELGAIVDVSEVVSLGVVTEAITNYSEVIYVYFWHDKKGTITGCYEGVAVYFDSINDVLKHPKMMDSVRWLLSECHERKLIP